MSDFVIVPGPKSDFVELSRSAKGHLFRKHILSKGTLNYNGKHIPIDDKFFATMEKNFADGVCPIVQVPVVGDDNMHTEDPFRNIGEVVRLEHSGSKLYAVLDARDEKAAEKIGKTLLGASAMFSMDYTDTRSDKKVGPTLLHVAVTNRPHVVELDDFEDLIAASAESSGENITLTSLKENPVTLDELLEELKNEHGIDVPELQTKAEQVEQAVALSAQLTSTLDKLNESGIVALSNKDGAVSNDDIVAAVAQLGEKNVELSAKVDTLVEDQKKNKAEVRVDELVKDGFILPAKRDAYLAILLSNAEQFEALIPDKPLVALSAETLVTPEDEQQNKSVEEEILRLTSSSAAKAYIK